MCYEILCERPWLCEFIKRSVITEPVSKRFHHGLVSQSKDQLSAGRCQTPDNRFINLMTLSDSPLILSPWLISYASGTQGADARLKGFAVIRPLTAVFLLSRAT